LDGVPIGQCVDLHVFPCVDLPDYISMNYRYVDKLAYLCVDLSSALVCRQYELPGQPAVAEPAWTADRTTPPTQP
jgi:hypothetical protein